MNDETTRYHAASSLEIKPLVGTTPRRVRPRARIRPCMASQLHDTLWRTASLRLEACAFEKAGSASAPRTAMSGTNRVALKARFHSDMYRWSLTRSGSFARSRDAMTATPSHQEDSSARTHELSQPKATSSQEQRSHPRGLASPTRMPG